MTFTVATVTSSSVSSEMELVVSGPKFSDVAEVARHLEAGLGGISGVGNIRSDLSAGKDEVVILPDSWESDRIGLTAHEVARQVSLYFDGRRVTAVNHEGVDMDVVLRAQPEDVDSIDRVRHLPVQGAAGTAKLGFIADVAILSGPTVISRRDGDRSATITAAVMADDTGAVGAEVRRLVDSIDKPPELWSRSGGFSVT